MSLKTVLELTQLSEELSPIWKNISEHPLYTTWEGMIQRCCNPNNSSYNRYGGAGITVCSRWRKSARSFIEDMGPRPENFTLDRINNNRGYTPENCRWASRATQELNKTNDFYKGVSYRPSRKKYRARYKNSGVEIFIGNFDYPEDAAKARDEYLYSIGVTEGLNFSEDYNDE
jgi:hypothetical protein